MRAPSDALAPMRARASATVVLNETLAALRAEGATVHSLASGDPDFATPQHIVEAAIASLRRGETHYAPTRGLPALLDAIARYRRERDGAAVDPAREVLVSPSAKAALATAIPALIGFGEKAMILTPSWVSYGELVRIAGGVPYEVPLAADDGFRLTYDRLRDSWQEGTRLLIVNSPNNPTGRIFDRDEVEALVRFSEERDLIIVSDEIYEEIAFARPNIGLLSRPEARERTVLVSGMSKAFAMSGWRLGYAVGPAALIDRLMPVHQHTLACVPAFVQRAGAAALAGPFAPVEAMTRAYRERCAAVLDVLSASRRLRAAMPDGAFYLFVDVSKTPHPDSGEFARRALREAGVLVVPGESFGAGGERHVRLGMTAPRATLAASARRLVDWLEASGDDEN